MTLHELLQERLRGGADRPALIGPHDRITFERLAHDEERLAGFFARSGLTKGDRVAVLLGRRYETVASLLAVSRAGGIVAPVNYRLSRSVLTPMLERVAPRFAVVQSDLGTEVLSDPGRWGLGSVREFVVVGGEEMISWGDAIEAGEGEQLPAPPDAADPVYLAFTSGTTGSPRAAVISHHNIYWNARATEAALELGDDDVHLLTFPSYMQPHELIARTLVCGGPTVLVESLRPNGVVAALHEFGVTCLVTVPRLARGMLPHLVEAGKPGRLRMVVLSSEPPTRALFAALMAQGIQVYSSWGSAETTGMALCGGAPGTLGRPCPYYEVAVTGEGDTGEMRIGGPGVSRGYYPQGDGRTDSLSEGWFRTGDLVCLKPGGELQHVGRIGALVDLAGTSIDLGEFERRLVGRPEFDAVMVRRHPRGARVVLYLVPAREEFDEMHARRAVAEELGSLWHGEGVALPSEDELLSYVRLSIVSALPQRSSLGGRAELLEVEEMVEEVDRRLVGLVNERATLVRRLREIRERGDLPPFDPGREEEMLRAVLGANTGPLYDQAMEEILRLIQDQTFLAD
jgi:acyl-CoA synthetase (AMP-forming)/AMP-acid ligase II